MPLVWIGMQFETGVLGVFCTSIMSALIPIIMIFRS
jgi:hypothetical protein